MGVESSLFLQGHGVSQCSQMNTSFPFLLVGVRNSRYQVARTSMDGRNYTPGKGGWSGREGQLPGPSEIVVRLPPGGGGGGGGWGGFLEDASRLGNDRWGAPVDFTGTQMSRPFRPWGATLLWMLDDVNVRFWIMVGTWWMVTARLPVSTLEMGDPTRGMRPTGAGRSAPPKPVVDVSNMRKNAVGRPLSVEATEFSPTLGPRTRGTAGSVAPSTIAGSMALVDCAGLSIPVVAGMKFSAVAEVHSSAVDVEDDTLVVRASEQRSEGSFDPRKSPGMVDRPMMEPYAPEPLEHSVLDEDLDGRPMEGLSVPEPLEHSVLHENLDDTSVVRASEQRSEGSLDPRKSSGIVDRPMMEPSAPEPLEHLVDLWRGCPFWNR